VTFKYFKIEEFACQETGENEIEEEFVHALDSLRFEAGFPFVITSGYRSPSHSIEAAKAVPGQHTTGRAADIAVSGGAQRYRLVAAAIKLGFSGIGVAKGFVHVDTRTTARVIWVY
jgi:uncharacterized protein YcbK (DUF882 family)